MHLLVLNLALVACGAPDAEKAVPIVAAPPSVAASHAPSLAPAPRPSPVPPALVAQAPSSPAAAPAASTTGALYFCLTGSANDPHRTPIAFAPSVEALCRKAPEMGPCQYERDACRRQGGKVLTAAGEEITPQTEADYDRRVLRIKMKSN
jgi:hypothetical protein